MVTVAQALAAGVRALASSDSARMDARLLLAHVLERSPEWLLAHDDASLSEDQLVAYQRACDVRANGMPLAYVIGTAWFCGREFVVNDRVLVPRPETEHLVEDAAARLRASDRPRALDVGTGSGAIACTLASEVAQSEIDAVDVSEDALNVAKTNAHRLGVDARVRFYQGDLLAPLPADRTYDAVVANLPYVPTADIDPSPAPVSFEPRLALDGGPDGLDLYRRLLPLLPARMRDGGIVLLEAAPPTIDALASLARTAFPEAAIDVRGDYGGRERYVCVRSVRPSTGAG